MLPTDRVAATADGGYVRAEAAALAFGREAVRLGADLVLNTRARVIGSGELVLERLEIDRRGVLSVARRDRLQVGAVVVAAGSSGAALLEDALARPVLLPSAVRQYPRVLRRAPTLPGLAAPAIELEGWVLRPAPAGWLLVPPVLPPDPAGYEPPAGRLMGVTVGVRRELLELLLSTPVLEPLLASGRLDLGKAPRNVRSARQSVPADGRAVAWRPGPEPWWLLAGGERGVDADVAAAARVASEVADLPPPWSPSRA